MFTLYYTNTDQVQDRSLWLAVCKLSTHTNIWDTLIILLKEINIEYAVVYILPEFPPLGRKDSKDSEVYERE